MKSIQSWLDDYGVSHKNPLNKTIHWICVPLIMISLIGLLWSIPPIPYPIELSPGLAINNWGIIFMIFALGYYLLLSWRLAIGMVFVATLMLYMNYCISTTVPLPLWQVSLAIFVLAWVGQFIGHKIEGAKPSFLEDLQFLLIGPLWLLHFIYKKIGLKYQ